MKKVARFEKVSKENYDKIISKLAQEGRLIRYLDGRLNFVDYDNITLPHRKTEGSAGYDFCITEDINLNPGEDIVIPTFIRCYITPGWDLGIYPRSGLGFKYRLRLANTIGIIDSDYYFTESDGMDNEGHIMVKIVNEGNSKIELKIGDRFCQGIFSEYGITIDDENVGKEVRSGGLGSTSL